jgi:hypothetical protein
MNFYRALYFIINGLLYVFIMLYVLSCPPAGRHWHVDSDSARGPGETGYSRAHLPFISLANKNQKKKEKSSVDGQGEETHALFQN